MITDRRIQRTRDALYQALMALVLEVPYDAITIQQIIDRANIGRSTFYTHFPDKDELLMWGTEHLRDTLSHAQRTASLRGPDILRFSRSLFEHADGYRDVYRALVTSSVWPHVRQRIQNVVAGLIRRECASMKLRARSKLPLDLFVHYAASTLMTVLTWWIDHNSALTPAEIDEVFRELVLPSISSVFTRAAV